MIGRIQMITFLSILQLCQCQCNADSAICFVGARSDSLVIVSSDSIALHVRLYNLIGVELNNFGKRQFRKGRNTIACSHLPAGIYILVFTSDSLRIIKRIIIHP